MEQKETPNSPMNGGQGVEVSKTLFYKGSYYKVGEGRLAMKDEKTEDDDYFILTLVAIAEELKINGLHHHNNVVIAAGTPFGRIGKEK
ncbi:MAG TPA: hypothetical protein IAC64_03410, partial [Candidatus Caccomorpha excrementavium]|nr:hypothetical protein [Candidatus Caccomorpha excrementavium]